MPEVSLVIVHWNTPAILKKQIERLIINNNFQIIVVDNASDKPLDWLKKDFPQVELIQNRFNRGYAFACNHGAINAIGKWLLFLNPDVEIKPETIFHMIAQADRENLDACSPMVGNNYQKPLPSWLTLLIEFTPINKIFNFINFKNFITLKTLFGGCLLIKKEVIEKLGGWDERFFLWFEDSDLTTRLLKNNHQIGFISPASLHRLGEIGTKHIGGQSFKLISSQTQRDIFFHSMDIFAKKHFSLWGKLIISLIKKRYTTRKLLPVLNNSISMTVPNLSKKLLEKFFSQNFHTPGVREEWIVVSSAINNDDVWSWRKKYPEVRFIPIEKNYGFAHTVNIGLRVSTGKWIGTVNDDVVLSKNWLIDILVEKQQDIGSLNPIIKNKTGKIESIGIKILPKGKALPVVNYDFSTDRDQSRKVTFSTDATNAAAVIYSKEALNKVGLFDERFGSYLEDVDLSLRLTRAGYKNLVSNQASIIHHGQQTSSAIGVKKRFMDFRNWIYVILKNWGAKKLILNFPAILFERLRNLFGIIKYFF